MISPDHARPRLVERYREFLPVGPSTPVVSLGEGATPLVHARRLGEAIGLRNLHLKVEGQNPTGSFKDRGMVLAVAKALEDGARSVICASTGNTSASAAAYAAAAGLECVVLLPAGKIAVGKLLQAMVFGARVISVRGNFDEALRVVRALSEQDEHPITLVNSVNPFRLEGQKTAAFEVCDDLGRAPDVLAIPVGNAGNISAYWRGFREYREAGRIDAVPRMWGFQAAGAAPLVSGRPVDASRDRRDGDPDRQPGLVDARDLGARRVGRSHRRRHRRRDPRGPSRRGEARGRVLRAVIGGLAGGRRQGGPRRRARSRGDGRVRADRQRPQGPVHRRSRVTVEMVEADASVADVSRALGWW